VSSPSNHHSTPASRTPGSHAVEGNALEQIVCRPSGEIPCSSGRPHAPPQFAFPASPARLHSRPRSRPRPPRDLLRAPPRHRHMAAPVGQAYRPRAGPQAMLSRPLNACAASPPLAAAAWQNPPPHHLISSACWCHTSFPVAEVTDDAAMCWSLQVAASSRLVDRY
jgi:hypothetical protein